MKYDLTKQYDPQVLRRLQMFQVDMLSDIQKLCEKHRITFFVVYGTAIGAVRHKGFIPWDDDLDIGMLRTDFDRFLKIAEKELGEKYYIMSPRFDKKCSSAVTKVVRKDTVFISEMSKDMKHEQGIFIDIFPFDQVASDVKQAKMQQLKTLFFDRLLYLRGSGKPNIPYDGIKGFTCSSICILLHGILSACRISPSWIFKQYEKAASKYENFEGNMVTYWGMATSLKEAFDKRGIFPIKKIWFENIEVPIPSNYDEMLKKTYGDYMKLPPENQRINHAPLMLKFPNEDAVINRLKV